MAVTNRKYLRKFNLEWYRRSGWYFYISTNGWYLSAAAMCPWFGIHIVYLARSWSFMRLETGYRIFGKAVYEIGESRRILDQCMIYHELRDRFIEGMV